MKALFEITKRSSRPNYSMLTPTGADFDRGMAFQESATENTSELADGSAPIVGFITRKCLQTGPTLSDAVHPGVIELPFQSGDEGSFEYAEEVEAEGGSGSAAQSPAAPSYVKTASTGAVAANTANKTLLSFRAGQFCIAQSGDFAEFILVAQQTPVLTNNVRIKARRIPAFKLP